MKPIRKFTYTLLASAMLTACGGGGGSSGAPDVANGGIGGSGSGTVTGFGSIFINDIREFEFNDATEIRIDGESTTEDSIKLGMVVEVNVDDDANDDFTSGTLLTVDAYHLVKGPVTSVNPLRVMSQDISVISATVLDGIPGNDVGNLALGDVVEIAGHQDATGLIRASRIEYKAGGAPVWQLRGQVTAGTGDLIQIGSQPVNVSGATVENCGGEPGVGDFVDIKATPVSDLADGESVLATKVECITPGLSAADAGSILKASFEGFIDSVITAGSRFTLNGQIVQVGATTVYENGSNVDLVSGAKVEAEGTLDAAGVLTAVKIRFREARVRIEAPLAAADIDSDTRFTVLGVQIETLPTTDDEVGIPGGISGDQQVEVRGFVDAEGTVYAEEIRDRGTADANDTEVRGPVTEKTAGGFTLLGLSVDLSGAILQDRNGDIVSESAFLQSLRIGQEVQVKDAAFNPSTRTLSGGEIEQED